MANYKYYLGPWEWVTDDDLSYWSAPSGTVGLVDLRGLVDCAKVGVLGDHPHGFFAVDPTTSLPSEYKLLGQGDLRDLQPGSSEKSAWQSLLSHTPAGTKLIDWLYDQLTGGSDPTYDGPTPPLMPTVAGNLEVSLAGHSIVKRERFRYGRHPHSNRIQAVLRNQFRRHHEDNPEHARRVLDYWLEKFSMSRSPQAQDWRQFVPPNLQRDVPGPRSHNTTVKDDFNRDDEQLDDSSNWTTTNGTASTYNVVSNQLAVSGFARVRFEPILSSDDHYSQIDLISRGIDSASKSIGLHCRFSTVGQDWYRFVFTFDATSTYRIFKSVGGTVSTIATQNASPPSSGEFRHRCDGSTVSARLNGSDIVLVTDSGVVGNLRTGTGNAHTDDPGATLDDFEAADLAAATGEVLTKPLRPTIYSKLTWSPTWSPTNNRRS